MFSFSLPQRIFAVLLQHRMGFATICRTTANFTNHWAQEVSLNRNWELTGKEFAWQTLVKYTLLWIKTWPEPLVSPCLGLDPASFRIFQHFWSSWCGSCYSYLAWVCYNCVTRGSITDFKGIKWVLFLDKSEYLSYAELDGSISQAGDWLVFVQPYREVRVTVDKMLKVSWHCEHGKLSAGMHYEELWQQIDTFFYPLVPSPVQGGCGVADGAWPCWAHSACEENGSGEFETLNFRVQQKESWMCPSKHKVWEFPLLW